MRSRLAKIGLASAAALLLVVALLRIAGPSGPRGAAEPFSSTALGGEGAAKSPAARPLAAHTRRGEPASPELAARDERLEPLTPLDPAHRELELRALIEHLVRLDELRDLGGVERALEEFLQRWGAFPGFAEALQRWLWRIEPPWKSGERAAVTLLARCWLASALGAGIYPIEEARRFALEFVQRAAASNDALGLELLRRVLAQSGDAEAPQLRGLAELGQVLLAHLDPVTVSAELRLAMIELLEDWGAREPTAAALFRGLLADPRADVRACAYRALLRADPGQLESLRASLCAEEPELLRSVASWLLQRPGGLGFDALRQIAEGLGAPKLAELRASALARDFALGPARLDEAAFAQAWESLRGDESGLGRELREGLLQGLGLGRPTAEQIELIRASSFDAELRRSALQALAIVDEAGAAMRLRELALSTAIAEREDAILASGNALAREHPPAELLDALALLLEDARLHVETRALLAEQLAPHRAALVEAWSRRMGR